MRLPTLVLLLALALSATAADTCPVDVAPRHAAIKAVDSAASSRRLAPIEGVWQTSPLTLITILRSGHSTYDITLYASDDLSLPLPMKVGSITDAPRPGLYDARLARHIGSSGKLHRMTSLAIELSIDGSWLEFLPYKKGVQLRLHRLIPYLFRFSLRWVDTSPQGLEGARRVYPLPPPTVENPLVL